MKRLVKYLIAILLVLVFVYVFWLWLQYKWATVIKQTTVSIMNELAKVDTLETVKKSFTETIEWEQQFASLLPDIWVDKIISSALFKEKLKLDVQGEVSAWYTIHDITTWSILVSRDGTVTIVLADPEILGVTLTWTTKSIQLWIITQSDIDMENSLRTKAGDLMIQKALSGNILQAAKINAQYVLQNLFLSAGIQIKEVIIKGTWDSK